MSLKADWEITDDHVAHIGEVIANRENVRPKVADLRRPLVADAPRVGVGHRPIGPAALHRAAGLRIVALRQGLSLEANGDTWTLGVGVSTRVRRAPMILSGDRLRYWDGREAPLRMTLDEVAAFLQEGPRT